jgi:hypothetical protein
MLINLFYTRGRYISCRSTERLNLAPAVPLKQVLVPWSSNFSGDGSSGGIFSATLCCGSSLVPSSLSLAPSSSSSSSSSSDDYFLSYDSLPVGRSKLSPAVATAVVAPLIATSVPEHSFLLPPPAACLILPQSSTAPPSTAPYAAAHFGMHSTVCTSASCTSTPSRGQLDSPSLSSSSTLPPPSSTSTFDGHTIMGCEGGGFGGCSLAVCPPSPLYLFTLFFWFGFVLFVTHCPDRFA